MVRSDVLRCGENSISDGFACPSSTMVKEVILLDVNQNMDYCSGSGGRGDRPKYSGSSPAEHWRPLFFERRPPLDGVLRREADCLQIPLVFDGFVEWH